jgi:hypothetical protein
MTKKSLEVVRRYRKCQKCTFFVMVDKTEPDEHYCTKLASTICYQMVIPCEVKHNSLEKDLE